MVLIPRVGPSRAYWLRSLKAKSISSHDATTRSIHKSYARTSNFGPHIFEICRSPVAVHLFPSAADRLSPSWSTNNSTRSTPKSCCPAPKFQAVPENRGGPSALATFSKGPLARSKSRAKRCMRLDFDLVRCRKSDPAAEDSQWTRWRL